MHSQFFDMFQWPIAAGDHDRQVTDLLVLHYRPYKLSVQQRNTALFALVWFTGSDSAGKW
ncbi:hypothetical protein CR103_20995 [Massilia psychrophila]|uniref:Uncharacterized protein n=1 Tax=Massilia psychrophila TaxID=1603353 RepID=A0A2G8SVW0_9BURK|nr:hypothetical protein CR103_20995 [Massilia psychrophila]